MKFPYRLSNRFKGRLSTGAALVMILAFVAVGLLPGLTPLRVEAQTPTTEQRTVTVGGSGSVAASPDLANISIGVDVQNEDLAAALKEAETRMTAVMAALKTAGVAENDIQTSRYNVFREDRFDQGPTPKAIYRVANVVRATVRDITKVNDVLSAGVNAGANVIDYVEFGISSTRTAETDARKLALEDAQQRASELAAAMGGTLGQIIRVEENTGNFGAVASYDRGMGGGGAGPVAPGSLQVGVSVVVTYEVK